MSERDNKWLYAEPTGTVGHYIMLAGFGAGMSDLTEFKDCVAHKDPRDAEIERLRAALEDEWKQNHWEKCGHDDCVSFGGSKPCHHERPATIAAYGQTPDKTDLIKQGESNKK